MPVPRNTFWQDLTGQKRDYLPPEGEGIPPDPYAGDAPPAEPGYSFPKAGYEPPEPGAPEEGDLPVPGQESPKEPQAMPFEEFAKQVQRQTPGGTPEAATSQLGAAPPLQVKNALGEDITNKPQSQVQQRDPWGRPTGPPPEQPGEADSNKMPMNQFQRNALQAAGQPPKPLLGMTQQQYNHELIKHKAHVDSLVTAQIKNWNQAEDHKKNLAFRAQEHRILEQTRIAQQQRTFEENQRKEAVKKEETLRKEQKEREELKASKLSDLRLKVRQGVVTQVYKNPETGKDELEFPPGPKREAEIQRQLAEHAEDIGVRLPGQQGKPPPPDPQLDRFKELKDMLAGSKSADSPRGLAEPELESPSRIGPEMVQQLHKVVMDDWEATPQKDRTFRHTDILGLLQDPIRQNRGLKVREHLALEKYIKQLRDLPLAGKMKVGG